MRLNAVKDAGIGVCVVRAYVLLVFEAEGEEDSGKRMLRTR